MLKSAALCAALVLSSSFSLGSREPIEPRPVSTSCPTIALDTGDEFWKLPLKPSAKVTFEDGSNPGITYKWTVTKGVRIKEGQGTSSITLELDPDNKPDGGSLTIIVEVGGLDSQCPNQATATISHFFG